MKSILILFFSITIYSNPDYIIINDTLYKMPSDEIRKIKDTYNIKDNNVTIYNFDTCNCYSNIIQRIIIEAPSISLKESLSVYKLKTNPYVLFEGKFVDMIYFYPMDIESITLIPLDEAIKTYGCKGLNPIFILKLKKGKTIQEKPVSSIQIRSQS